MQRLNRALHDECRQNVFTFVYDGAVSENELWVNGIQLKERGKCIIENKPFIVWMLKCLAKYLRYK